MDYLAYLVLFQFYLWAVLTHLDVRFLRLGFCHKMSWGLFWLFIFWNWYFSLKLNSFSLQCAFDRSPNLHLRRLFDTLLSFSGCLFGNTKLGKRFWLRKICAWTCLMSILLFLFLFAGLRHQMNIFMGLAMYSLLQWLPEIHIVDVLVIFSFGRL